MARGLSFDQFLEGVVRGESAEGLVERCGERVAPHWFDQCNGALLLARHLKRDELVVRLSTASDAIDCHLTQAEA